MEEPVGRFTPWTMKLYHAHGGWPYAMVQFLKKLIHKVFGYIEVVPG